MWSLVMLSFGSCDQIDLTATNHSLYPLHSPIIISACPSQSDHIKWLSLFLNSFKEIELAPYSDKTLMNFVFNKPSTISLSTCIMKLAWEQENKTFCIQLHLTFKKARVMLGSQSRLRHKKACLDFLKCYLKETIFY